MEARIATANAIAAAVRKCTTISIDVRVWQRGDIVRVYVNAGRNCRTKYGYIDVTDEGIDCREIRGCISESINAAAQSVTNVA